MPAPQIFGIEHIIYLVLTLSATVAVWILAAKYCKSEKASTILIKCVAAALFLAIAWNRISIACYSDRFWVELIPSSFCGMSSLLFSTTTLIGRRNCKALHCVAYVAALGGLLTIAYPDFIGQSDSIFFSKTISGLAHHSLMILLFGLIIITGYLKPTIRNWYILPLGLCVYMTFGLFIMQVFDLGNPMYINDPILEGTPLVWYNIGFIFLGLHILLLGGWELLVTRRRAKAAAKAAAAVDIAQAE